MATNPKPFSKAKKGKVDEDDRCSDFSSSNESRLSVRIGQEREDATRWQRSESSRFMVRNDVKRYVTYRSTATFLHVHVFPVLAC